MGSKNFCYSVLVPQKFLSSLKALDLEERILNGCTLLALGSIFLPWIGGDWPGGVSVSYNGLQFLTSHIGLLIFILHVTVLLLTAVPLFGGPILVRKRYREKVRLLLSLQALILIFAALSVLMRTSTEFTRMNIRFGMYTCLAASIIAFFEAAHRYATQRKLSSHETFHHPEDTDVPDLLTERSTPPPPPPPPPPAPSRIEDHPRRIP